MFWCAQMLTNAVAQVGCTDTVYTVRESAPKVDHSRRKKNHLPRRAASAAYRFDALPAELHPLAGCLFWTGRGRGACLDHNGRGGVFSCSAEFSEVYKTSQLSFDYRVLQTVCRHRLLARYSLLGLVHWLNCRSTQ